MVVMAFVRLRLVGIVYLQDSAGTLVEMEQLTPLKPVMTVIS